MLPMASLLELTLFLMLWIWNTLPMTYGKNINSVQYHQTTHHIIRYNNIIYMVCIYMQFCSVVPPFWSHVSTTTILEELVWHLVLSWYPEDSVPWLWYYKKVQCEGFKWTFSLKWNLILLIMFSLVYYHLKPRFVAFCSCWSAMFLR